MYPDSTNYIKKSEQVGKKQIDLCKTERLAVTSNKVVHGRLLPGSPWIPKSDDAQVPYIAWCSICV